MAVSLREVVSFGRYEPLFRIASGGMAEVYAARIRGEAGFQKLVAVKRMHPHLANDATFVDMFLNEARLAANIASPYVVATLDLGRGSDGSLYIVMELVVGLSLATLHEDRPGPLPAPVAIELMAQAAQGLDDAHEATTPAGDPLGLIHRDVSPHNILLGVDGRARVTDFGIAHAVHRPREETNIKELKGKFAYMSPEQTRLKPLDRRSDVFSLGVVAWEALVGRRLFAEDDPTASIANVRKLYVPPPHVEAPEVPPAISEVVLQALERDPDARFASGAEFALALREVGRSAFGRLPTRKDLGAFVSEAGGDELERLRRLIRLGTEGADEAAIEAVKPGVTRVFAAGDASGVARLGTGARRQTAVLEDGPPPTASIRVPVVTLSPDDEPAHTAELDLLSGREVPTAILMTPEETSTTIETDAGPTRALRARHRALAPPTDDPTRAWERGPAAAEAPARAPGTDEGAPSPKPAVSRRYLQIGVLAAACAIVCFAIGVAAALLLDDAPARRLPSDPVLPPPSSSIAPRDEVALPPSAPMIADEEPEAVDLDVAEDEAAAPEAEPGVAPRRVRRRGRRRATPSSTDRAPGDLMGVDAFDRHTP